METIKIELEPLTCPSCIAKIENVLSKIKGVEAVQVLFHSSKVKLQVKKGEVDPELVYKLLNKLGYHTLAPSEGTV